MSNYFYKKFEEIVFPHDMGKITDDFVKEVAATFDGYGFREICYCDAMEKPLKEYQFSHFHGAENPEIKICKDTEQMTKGGQRLILYPHCEPEGLSFGRNECILIGWREFHVMALKDKWHTFGVM